MRHTNIYEQSQILSILSSEVIMETGQAGGSLSSEGKILLLFAAASRDADLPNMPAAITAAVTPPQICSQVAFEHELNMNSSQGPSQQMFNLNFFRALS